MTAKLRAARPPAWPSRGVVPERRPGTGVRQMVCPRPARPPARPAAAHAAFVAGAAGCCGSHCWCFRRCCSSGCWKAGCEWAVMVTRPNFSLGQRRVTVSRRTSASVGAFSRARWRGTRSPACSPPSPPAPSASSCSAVRPQWAHPTRHSALAGSLKSCSASSIPARASKWSMRR